jgi:hypothetical protein
MIASSPIASLMFGGIALHAWPLVADVTLLRAATVRNNEHVLIISGL